MNRTIAAIAFAAAVVLPSGAALADSDDIKWIAQCMLDNKDAKGITEPIVHKYCACMNNKMSSNESQSMTQWEKTHKAEREACDKEAGWR